MAKVVTRTRSDGGTSYRVQWVIGGGRAVKGAAPGAPGSQASETFTRDLRLMQAFKAAVEAQGHQWPVGWVKGHGWVAPGTPPPIAATPVEEQPAPRAVTVEDVYTDWLAAEQAKLALRRKKPKSLGRDVSIYERLIRPRFGAVPFTAVERREVARWVAEMTAAGAAPKTVRNRHAVFHSIAQHGCLELRLRPDNPCARTPLPRDDYDRQIRFFDHGEWSLVRRCLRSDVHTMVDVALTTGLRWGELSALRVGDLSRQPGDDPVLNVHVSRAWSERDPRFDTDPIDTAAGETVRYKLGPTKTRKDRWVQVSGTLADELWHAAAGRGQDEYLFTTARGNPWRYPDFHTDRWEPAIRRAKEHGLTKHGTFHMLRHTFVVWLIADGESLPVVSARLGHASIQITMDRYGGLLDLHDAGTAKRMARQLSYAQTAVIPAALRNVDVDSQPVRPGRRGQARRRRSA